MKKVEKPGCFGVYFPSAAIPSKKELLRLRVKDIAMDWWNERGKDSFRKFLSEKFLKYIEVK